ncbi:hypothetical protein [Streptomyces sp. NPDC057460]|uniref:hypothetical protein n=1 Tax=Streptomyces sp. NPDC057460 TaxID=3346141 RepID=UPI00368CB060
MMIGQADGECLLLAPTRSIGDFIASSWTSWPIKPPLPHRRRPDLVQDAEPCLR